MLNSTFKKILVVALQIVVSVLLVLVALIFELFPVTLAY
jgi:hypothetical protein